MREERVTELDFGMKKAKDVLWIFCIYYIRQKETNITANINDQSRKNRYKKKIKHGIKGK